MAVLVCLSASNEWYGKAIRWLTHSNVNHAFIAYTSQEWGGWWAVQIDERGVIKIPAEKVKHSYLECYDLGIDLTPAMIRTRKLYGERYDWLGIAGFVIKLIYWRLFGRKIANPIHRKGQLFCSEFVTTYLKNVDGMYDGIKLLDPCSVAPGGPPEFLGTPSLQFELNMITAVKKVPCPWESGD